MCGVCGGLERGYCACRSGTCGIADWALEWGGSGEENFSDRIAGGDGVLKDFVEAVGGDGFETTCVR